MTVESSPGDIPPSTTSSPAQSHAYPKRTLHSKRSFHKHGPGGVGTGSMDSPAYDASEEDNDPTTDDGDGGSSTGPVASRRPNANVHSNTKNGIMHKKHQSVAAIDDEDPGVDSPTYDGDIESYTAPHPHGFLSSHREQYSSSENTASTLTSPIFQPGVLPLAISDSTSLHRSSSAFSPATPSPLAQGQYRAQASPKFDPTTITPSEIQSWVQSVVAGYDGEYPRNYKINPPPEGRPVIIYADGVYDLFHYGHALQLRQAKFSFPSVHLLVGVNSDELVRANKANTIMNHAERCEAVKNCKWADGVIPEAPWIITNEFLMQHHIDYVAHDESPYAAPGHDDVYALVKAQGKFLPTRRTPGISTSLLLSRIVARYRTGYLNSKLEQNGNEELSWRDGDGAA